jgi:hypothetical protein
VYDCLNRLALSVSLFKVAVYEDFRDVSTLLEFVILSRARSSDKDTSLFIFGSSELLHDNSSRGLWTPQYNEFIALPTLHNRLLCGRR